MRGAHRIRRILVAIKDVRSRQLAIVRKATQLARALDAEVCLFHGIADPIYVDLPLDGQSLPELEQQSRHAYLARAERIAKRMRRLGVKTSAAVEWDFPGHEAVIRAARRFQADLIIAQCHASQHLAPWLLHFTDWELLRNSPVPVLLIRNRRAYHGPNILAAIDPGPAAHKPARLDRQILSYGATIAAALHGALHAVHAYDPLPTGMAAAELVRPRSIAKAQAQTAAAAHAAVDRAVQPFAVPQRRRHIQGGFAIDVIQNVSEQIHAAILVLGALSRSGLRGLFIGNTAERMLDRLSCDVLIVKPRNFRSRVARAPRGVRYAARPLFGSRPSPVSRSSVH